MIVNISGLCVSCLTLSQSDWCAPNGFSSYTVNMDLKNLYLYKRSTYYIDLIDDKYIIHNILIYGFVGIYLKETDTITIHVIAFDLRYCLKYRFRCFTANISELVVFKHTFSIYRYEKGENLY